ncbi:hypothetical protein HDU97_006491 [Phlyctochytrium planicorne]|nr:hypothetical protein HDU97_006491 [Phlyctochytrium planicorne]
MHPYTAVIFDIGGVVVHSPLEGIRSFEKKVGLPKNYLNAKGSQGAFQKLERSELTLTQFYPLFSADVSSPTNITHYNAYLRSHSQPPLPTDFIAPKIDGRDLFISMMKESEKMDLSVVEAVKKIRKDGRWKVAALTNNFAYKDRDGGEDALGEPPVGILKQLFEFYIESSVVGLRKPDPRFFLHACEVVGVKPEEVVFLDDIGINLKAAKDLGMTTIRVHVGKSHLALRELEKILGIPLLETSSKL